MHYGAAINASNNAEESVKQWTTEGRELKMIFLKEYQKKEGNTCRETEINDEMPTERHVEQHETGSFAKGKRENVFPDERMYFKSAGLRRMSATTSPL